MRVLVIMRGQGGVPGRAGVPGGQIGMVQLARALSRLGVEVELFVGGPRPPYLAGLDDVRIDHFRWPAHWERAVAALPRPLQEPAAAFRRRRWLDAVSALPGLAAADVVHVQGLQDAEALLTRFTGRIVVTHWGRVNRWRAAGTARDEDALRIKLAALHRNTEIVAIGDVQAEELSSVGLPPVAVIPPGIDIEHFTPGDRTAARQVVGFGKDEELVLYVGRLTSDKNVETLMRAVASTSGHPGGRRHLLIVGDGPLREPLQRLAVDLSIDSMTTFRSFVPHSDLPAYYRASDVTVVPSDRLETFCMVALEAIACGSSLVVTDQVPEILRHFPGTPAVQPYDVVGMSRMIDEAVDGHTPPTIPIELTRYDWTSAARQYIDVYRSKTSRSA
ncbi:MAG: glycosyltransferase family 4 protein [Pseudonocardia sp.]